MADSELPPEVALRSRPSRGGGEAPLTRERIVSEAVALLDEEGSAGLTMRRLAQRLRHGPTTLYWHVQTKDDVLDLALDAIFAEVVLPPESQDWRADLVALLTQWRAVMVRHPWSATMVERPMLGPNVLARTEFLHRAVLRAGLLGPRLITAVHGLANYVIGSALSESQWRLRGDNARDSAAAYLWTERERYPTLVEHGYLTEHDWDASFTEGLGYLLDGMEGRARREDSV
ncbi:transcriptional regulator [Saccharomonospora marina XMU15]|uniref:Transcriptional regulator n=1 Tax=Saccharomonospora marina XMU15 TaxID=882083 RepID=H5WWF1_9PSEU|nr:transcriptional regulator [Saccharomonospora marina XMU15]